MGHNGIAGGYRAVPAIDVHVEPVAVAIPVAVAPVDSHTGSADE